MSNLILDDVDNLVYTFQNKEYIDEGRLKTILKAVSAPTATMLTAGAAAGYGVIPMILSSSSAVFVVPAVLITSTVLSFAIFGYSRNKINELIKFGKFTDEVRNIQKSLDKAPPGTKEQLKELYAQAKDELKNCRTEECNAKALKVFIEKIKNSEKIHNKVKRDILDNTSVILNKSEKLVEEAKKDS